MSYCFRIYMIGESLGIDLKAPLLAETNCTTMNDTRRVTFVVDEKELDLSYIEFKRITNKEGIMTVSHLQREYPDLPTNSVLQPVIRVCLTFS